MQSVSKDMTKSFRQADLHTPNTPFGLHYDSSDHADVSSDGKQWFSKSRQQVHSLDILHSLQDQKENEDYCSVDDEGRHRSRQVCQRILFLQLCSSSLQNKDRQLERNTAIYTMLRLTVDTIVQTEFDSTRFSKICLLVETKLVCFLEKNTNSVLR